MTSDSIANSGEPVITVRCLKHVYPDRTLVNLCGLDFRVMRGQRVAIVGANGSGKSTLLLHLVGLLKPVEGSVRVLGVDPAKEFAKIRHRIGVVLQNADEQIIGPTVWDDVTFPLRGQGLRRDEIEARGRAVLAALGIEDVRGKVPHYLSSGQKRKVALAGALITEPEILILDEPFTGLDPRSKSELVDLLRRLHREKGMTYVVTLHEVDLVPELADLVYVITREGITMKGSPREVFARPDVLEQANLDVPTLVRLFQGLKASNLDVDIPLTLAEAADALRKLTASSVF